MQCFIYQVPPNKHENLCKIWVLRKYESMQAQIVLQDTKQWIENYGRKDLASIYLIEKFVWNHLFVNIHKCIMLDIFY